MKHQPIPLGSTLAAALPAASCVLTLTCADRPGIVAAFSETLLRCGCNVTEAQQFNDRASGRFFSRVMFEPVAGFSGRESIEAEMGRALLPFGADWKLRAVAQRSRVLILVSRFDHCAADLLYRWRSGELDMDIAGIVSNYPADSFAHLDFGALPFFHLPVTPETKQAQEERLLEIVAKERADLVVLARYMQILTGRTAALLHGRCINIHHSFLPGFKGARPYHQAHERGVKLIGATAHYVTDDLDEGPIVEQDVERISHGDRPEDLIRKGRDIERRVLARAVRLHLQDRIFLNGRTTVVFA